LSGNAIGLFFVFWWMPIGMDEGQRFSQQFGSQFDSFARLVCNAVQIAKRVKLKEAAAKSSGLKPVNIESISAAGQKAADCPDDDTASIALATVLGVPCSVAKQAHLRAAALAVERHQA
jgi:hypothetical protein